MSILRRLFLICIFVLTVIRGYSQNEFNSKFKAIPPLDRGIPAKKANPTTISPPVIVAPNIFKKPEEKLPSTNFRIGEPTKMSMVQTNDFVNPGDAVRDKLNKNVEKTLVTDGLKEDTSYLNVKDLDFGVIRTKDKHLVIKVRDYGAIDGDLIKAVITRDYKSEVLVASLYLESSFKLVKIELKEGINNLELEALNRGTLGGNTGEFYIYDSQGTLLLSDLWNNFDKGVKSKFTIIKE